MPTKTPNSTSNRAKTKRKSHPKLPPRHSTRQRTSDERAIARLSDALVERAKKDSQSKQPRFQDKNDPQGMFSSTYSWLKRAELCEPDYKSDSRKRDQWLREFWHHEPHLAGVMNAVTVIDKNRGFTLTGGRNQVNRFLQVLHGFEVAPGLRGWRPAMAAQSLSYWATDMGTITEPGTEGDGGPLRALYHVDSARCMLTGRHSSPLQYYPTKGGLQNWKDVDFFRTVSMPSDDEKMNGLGFCAISRSLEMAKVMCLHPQSPVLLADGTSMMIGKLVKTHYEGYVMSLDKEGQLVPKKIIGWHKNPRNGRRMINLRGHLTRHHSGGGARPTNTWVTEDHPILTPDGWRKAGELKTGDLIVTKSPQPNSRQMALIVGTLLGDAFLKKGNAGIKSSISFAQKHHSYSRLKAKALNCFEWFGSIMNKDNGNSKECLSMRTNRYPVLTKLYQEFYPEGKKVFPKELFSKYLSPILIAAWYLDDGSINISKKAKRRPTCNIAANEFTFEEVEYARDCLKEYGYDVNIHSAGVEGQYRIWFKPETCVKFFKDIAPYVPEEMRYKLPKDVADSIPFDEKSWELGKCERFIDEVIVSEINTSDQSNTKQVYCIDVEDTHNFISAGIVVHNCAVLNHDLEMLGAKMPKGLLLLKGISQDQWDTAMSAREDKLKELEREYFAGVFVLASSGLDDVDAKLVALSSLPAGFDMEVFTNQLMYGYALCFGYDPTEFWPVNAGVMGRGKETDIQHRKATGKGGLDFALGFQEGLQNRLPDSILFEFEQRDSEGELLEAQVQSAWVEIATKLYESGLKDGAPLLAPTTDEARQRALQILVESGSTLISEDWVVNEKKVIVDDSDTNEVRQLRERMVEDPRILRAIQKYPDEPIVRYEYGTDASGLPRQRMKTLWPVAYEAVKKRVYLAAVVRSVKSTLGDYAITVHTLGNLLITDGDMTRDGYEESLRHVSRAAAVYSFLKGKYPKRGQMNADETNMLDAAEYVLGLLPGELAEADERDDAGALFSDDILREMLGDGWDVLSSLLSLNDESAVSFAEAIENGEYDQDEGGLIDRADMWADAAQGMYHAGHLYRSGNPKYRWDYQPGKVHCVDCDRLNGVVGTAEYFLGLGLWPQSYNLSCRGYRCGCSFSDAS